ncbi:uncharacterized protein LOC108153926, partial [Drosophila miranda]|uniref:uncharacterized protein LOC108153926 n=1 Tax=Drosophila miranda TaxID=7229 RepID=UPI0007E66B06
MLLLACCVLLFQLTGISGSVSGSDFSHVGSEELQQFKQCVRGVSGQRPRLTECLGRSALNFIQRVEESDNVSFVEDFLTVKSDSAAAGRSLANVLDTDPVDFRGILENAGAVMGQRSLEWHMDSLYPGLMFKIGPTTDANSVAEFVLDGAGVQGERQFGYEEPTAGRLLAKQYLLPFLLGLKFNLVALVPLLFAGICLLLKKSLFLVKLAVYVSSFLGFGGVVSSLGGLGGLGGGLGGFDSFGGGSNFGFHGHRPVGHFPGKTTVFGHGDELHHQHQQQYDVHEASPYRRSERKVRFEQPRAAETSSPAPNPHPPTEDRFYDFEHQHRPSNKLLAASVEQEAAGSADTLMRNFHTASVSAGMQGWQALDVWHCLGSESERLLETAARDNSTWRINDYLSIEPPPEEVAAATHAHGTDRSDSGAVRESSASSGFAGKLLQLVQGRALRVQLPRELTISNAIDDFGTELGFDQGRKKKDKDKHMAMMGGMIMMATVAQMFLGKVILIAGSAFIMAKIALIISLLGSLKKGSSGHSGSSSPEHVIVTGSGSGSGHSHESGWHRSMPTHVYSSSQLEQIEEPPAHAHDQGYYAYEMETRKRRQSNQPQLEEK